MVKTKKKRSPRLVALDRTQAIANRYARLRDLDGEEGTFCISCNTWTEARMLDGGHFIPAGSSHDIRFDERNINAQCQRCNRFLHGNYRHYYHGMMAKYGKKIVQELEDREKLTHKWTLPELLEIEIYYKDKIAKLL